MINKVQALIFKRSADTLYASGDYTSATILYFKTLFAIQDFLLLEESGESPKDHSARFRSLEKYFPDLFRELDIEFSTYRDTYSKLIDNKTRLLGAIGTAVPEPTSGIENCYFRNLRAKARSFTPPA